MNHTKHQFSAGTYYIGDLCYIIGDQWDEVCDHGFPSEPTKLSDGRVYVTFGTEYGDGAYLDKEGREYLVDSGMIGCIRVKRGQEPVQGGHLIKFTDAFSPCKDGAIIKFGPVEIDTDPEEEEECPCRGRCH